MPRTVYAAVRAKRGRDERRKAALGRIADHANGGEGQASSRREFRRDVRFHVDRRGAALVPNC
jgi:hypothetical protein